MDIHYINLSQMFVLLMIKALFMTQTGLTPKDIELSTIIGLAVALNFPCWIEDCNI